MIGGPQQHGQFGQGLRPGALGKAAAQPRADLAFELCQSGAIHSAALFQGAAEFLSQAAFHCQPDRPVGVSQAVVELKRQVAHGLLAGHLSQRLGHLTRHGLNGLAQDRAAALTGGA